MLSVLLTIDPFFYLIAIGEILIVYIVFDIIRTLLQFSLVRLFAHHKNHKTVFQQPSGKQNKILIVGDSTAVGVGAKNPEETIAGRLTHDFPNSEILNLSTVGGRTANVVEQFKIVEGQKFDVIFISVGGNDVWTFTPLSRLRRTLNTVLETAIGASNHRTILLIHNSIKYAPLFSKLFRTLFGRRMDKVQRLFEQVCAEKKVPCIELFVENRSNPFMTNRQLFSKDGIHPSSEGYRLWYQRMWLIMVKEGFTIQGTY